MNQRERLILALAVQLKQAFKSGETETLVELFVDRTMFEVRALMMDVCDILCRNGYSIVEGWNIQPCCKVVTVELRFQE